jgi:hypothetical protein
MPFMWYGCEIAGDRGPCDDLPGSRQPCLPKLHKGWPTAL